MCRLVCCLPAQSQDHGDSRNQPVTREELDGAVEGPEPISSTAICPFIQGTTGQAKPEPHKMTSSTQLV